MPPQALGPLCARLAALGGRAAGGVVTEAKASPACYLLCQESQLAATAAALVAAGHCVRPAAEAFGPGAGGAELGELSPGVFADVEGVWAEAAADAAAPARLRILARCGLFVEVHFGHGAHRAVAGAMVPPPGAKAGALFGAGGAAVRRQVLVDTEPLETGGEVSTRITGTGMEDSPGGERWQRLAAGSGPVAALELAGEEVSGKAGAKRVGLWLVSGDVSLSVLGPPRGHGLLGTTACRSSQVLRSAEGDPTVDAELRAFAAVHGAVEKPGCIRAQRCLWGGSASKGALLCGAAEGAGARFLEVPKGAGAAPPDTLCTQAIRSQMEVSPRPSIRLWNVKRHVKHDSRSAASIAHWRVQTRRRSSRWAISGHSPFELIHCAK